MTALTPNCDPDMSVTGSPFGAMPHGGPRLLSGSVLLAVVALAALVVGADAAGVVTVPAVAAGLLCALALVRRGLRVAHRAGAAAAAAVVRAAHRSGPVPTPTR